MGIIDARTLDLIITGLLSLFAATGAFLTYNYPPKMVGRMASYGYFTILSAVMPIFLARVFGPGGLGVFDTGAQRMLLATGHTVALIFATTLLIYTVKRVRKDRNDV